MKNKSVSLGPGAASLILVVMILSMTTLGTLTLISARNDRQLGSRSIRMNEAFYALQSMAEKRYAQLDAVLQENEASLQNQVECLSLALELLPENAECENDTLTWREESGGRQLVCRAQVRYLADGVRFSVLGSSFVAETEEIWNWN